MTKSKIIITDKFAHKHQLKETEAALQRHALLWNIYIKDKEKQSSRSNPQRK